jgi:hypothetical protein
MTVCLTISLIKPSPSAAAASQHRQNSYLPFLFTDLLLSDQNIGISGQGEGVVAWTI